MSSTYPGRRYARDVPLLSARPRGYLPIFSASPPLHHHHHSRVAGGGRRVVAPLCPRPTARLHVRSPMERTEPSRSWSSHLFRGRPGERRHVRSGRRLNRGYMCNLLHTICCMQIYSARRPSDAKIIVCNELQTTNCMQQIACNYFRIWAGLSLSIRV